MPRERSDTQPAAVRAGALPAMRLSSHREAAAGLVNLGSCLSRAWRWQRPVVRKQWQNLVPGVHRDAPPWPLPPPPQSTAAAAASRARAPPMQGSTWYKGAPGEMCAMGSRESATQGWRVTNAARSGGADEI